MALPAYADGLLLRELPVEEWPRLAEAGGPLSGHLLPPSDTARIIVAETAEGRIVLYWVSCAQVHLDPIYIEPEYRHRPHLLLGAIGMMLQILQEMQVSYAFTFVADGDQPGNGILMEKLGLSKLPASVYGGQLIAPGADDRTLPPRPGTAAGAAAGLRVPPAPAEVR